MLGSAIKSTATDYEICAVGSKDYNLNNFLDTDRMIKDINPDAIIHLAAKVGGVKANTDNVAEFYTDNIQINTNVLSAAHHNNIHRVVSLLSTCIYPDKASYPLTEQQIHAGPPHQSNFGYAYAKRMLDVQSQAYRQQYSHRYITVVPNNLFGEHDNFDLENSHVIPAMIRKMYEAKLENKDVVLWGDGSPLREFTYSKDLAKILLFLLDRYDEPTPINVGNTKELSIKHVAQTIADTLGFTNRIIWDIAKPMGQHRKPSSNSRLLQLGWNDTDYTDFKQSINATCEWFISQYPNVRGI